MQRIQVFLREDQKTDLESLSRRMGVRQSDLVRQGVDLVLERASAERVNWRAATRPIAGLWRDRDNLEATTGDVRRSVKRRFPDVYGRD